MVCLFCSRFPRGFVIRRRPQILHISAHLAPDVCSFLSVCLSMTFKAFWLPLARRGGERQRFGYNSVAPRFFCERVGRPQDIPSE